MSDQERKDFEAKLERYWSLAYHEGKTGESRGSEANEVLAQLRAALAQQAVPEGFALVPVEPTEEMIHAAHDALEKYPLEGNIRRHYRAMLAAAPAAPQASQGAAVGAEPCAICGEGKALLMRCCNHCGSEYAGAAEMMENYRALAVGAWQPIKTAPKDGTHILVWTDASDTAYVVCWADAAKGIRKYLTAESGAERGWHLAWDGALFDGAHEPTHWMPLPDSPAGEQDAELDAWECPDCGGAGRRSVYRAVTHQLGTDELPFMEACETCDGVGSCGPDAEKRAELSKPPVQGSQQ